MNILKHLSYMVAALCTLPLILVALLAFDGDLSTWNKLATSVLPDYALTTLLLTLSVGLGVMITGTLTGWLIATCRFPGRVALEVLLVAPLAFPAYVLAYAYTDLLDHPGPVQTTLRSLMGWGPREYWFPEIRSFGGAAFMLIFVLSPYVYLMARSCFMGQSPTTYYAARTLGESPLSSFMKISFPLALPAIMGGVLLAMMETLADYGTVTHFGVQTLASGLYRAWFAHGDQAAATQLALLLLVSAALLILLAYYLGTNKRKQPRKQEPPPLQPLTGWLAFGATLACFLPVLLGFLLPLVYLSIMAFRHADTLWTDERYTTFMYNSLSLATGAALLIVMTGFVIVATRRFWPGSSLNLVRHISGFGYAIPGGVIAIGLLLPFSYLDRAMNTFLKNHAYETVGLIFTGSFFLLILALGSRFMAAALNALENGYDQIRPNLDAAARTLGTNNRHLFFRVHIPLLPNAVIVAFILVFVDIMKELPITLMLRPFNFDTLAVQAYQLASDERLSEAALPSLMIMVFAMVPVMILTRHFYLRRQIGSI